MPEITPLQLNRWFGNSSEIAVVGQYDFHRVAKPSRLWETGGMEMPTARYFSGAGFIPFDNCTVAAG